MMDRFPSGGYLLARTIAQACSASCHSSVGGFSGRLLTSSVDVRKDDALSTVVQDTLNDAGLSTAGDTNERCYASI